MYDILRSFFCTILSRIDIVVNPLLMHEKYMVPFPSSKQMFPLHDIITSDLLCALFSLRA